jgi:hypothetical protein
MTTKRTSKKTKRRKLWSGWVAYHQLYDGMTTQLCSTRDAVIDILEHAQPSLKGRAWHPVWRIIRVREVGRG